jgi:predicted TIM-barrel fold metal-dependent hydrolase
LVLDVALSAASAVRKSNAKWAPATWSENPMIVDIYTHIFPDRFFAALEQGSPKLGNMGKRLRGVPKLFNLDLRFKDMDEIGDDYRQIISLPNPPIEDIAEGEVANNLAKVANDAMAELVAKHPKRFPAFAAAVHLNDVDFSIREADRAIKMGARGVQTFTNITGHPLDEPRFRPFFDAMARHDLPIWMHPARTSAMPDYASETRSRFEMWWCFGWPYETTIAMCRLVFDGLFDRHPKIKIVTHHLGGGMIPFFDGRIGAGMEVLGQRTADEDHTKVLSSLKRPHLDYFKEFYADTAMFGGTYGLPCGLSFFGADKVVFASDAPLAGIPMHIKALDGLNLDAATRQKIMHGNAEKLLNMRIS